MKEKPVVFLPVAVTHGAIFFECSRCGALLRDVELHADEHKGNS